MSALALLKVALPGIGDDQDALLSELLARAEDYILAYTYRSTLPPALTRTQVSLATLYYNRLGIEGESSHSEGGVSRSIDEVPTSVEGVLLAWRRTPDALRREVSQGAKVD